VWDPTGWSTGGAGAGGEAGAEAGGGLWADHWGKFVGAGVLFFGARRCVQVVPAGHVGIYDLWGNVHEKPCEPGLHFKNPMAKIRPMSTKTQKIDLHADVPSNEGLNIGFEFSVQYRLDPNNAVEMFKTVGMDYEDTLIKPQVKSAIRSETSSRDAKALYSSEREQIKNDLQNKLNTDLGARGIIIEDVPLRSIELPENLRVAIERKLGMEQESQRMEFVLQQERQEAERKAIEAQGIADFQSIVTQGIDDKLLKWKGIEATTELAKSTNSKVVVIGSGKDGLPIILGDQQAQR